jgi:predicted GNAT family N-acyltransferase
MVFGWDNQQAWRMARAIRQAVFVVEQACPAEEEWDGLDLLARHLLAWPGDAVVGDPALDPVGVARWRWYEARTAKLERFAVLAPARGTGVAKRLVASALADAREAGAGSFVLHAQTQAMGLYRGFGFVAEGDEFFEAGISHRRMRLVDPEVS